MVIAYLLVEPDPAHPGKFQVAVTASGGTPFADGYRYRRCNSAGAGGTGWQVSNLLTNIPTGDYIIRVKDKNACETEQLVTVGAALRHGNEGGFLFKNEKVQSRVTVAPEFEIRLYPNPASTEVNVFVSGGLSEESIFEITDFTGKTVRRINASTLTGELNQINLTDLPPGAYQLRWLSEGKMLAAKSFIVVQN